MQIDSLKVQNCVERLKALKPGSFVTVVGAWASDLNLWASVSLSIKWNEWDRIFTVVEGLHEII